MNTGNESLKILEKLEKEFIKDGFETLKIRPTEDHELLVCKNGRIYSFFVWHDIGFGANKIYRPIMCGYMIWIENEKTSGCSHGYTRLSPKNDYDEVKKLLPELDKDIDDEVEGYNYQCKSSGVFENGLNNKNLLSWLEEKKIN